MHITRARTVSFALLVTIAVLATPACDELDKSPASDGRDDTFLVDGKVDAFGVEEGTPTAEAVLMIANGAPYDVLVGEIGLDERPAGAIVAHRLGPDGQVDTPDDDRFDSLTELDGVEWVGPIAFERLIGFAIDQGLLTPSVIGGQMEEGYPFAGYLETNGRLHCTMVLVAPDKVLTAAHCIEQDATHSIGFGKYSIFNKVWLVDEIYIHPEYSRATYRHDIAVLTLKEPVTDRQPAVIDEIGASGCGYRGVGYGRSDEGLKTDPFSSWEWAERKSVQHCIVNQLAERVYVDGINGAICWGDSGGPLFIDGSNRVVAVLSGSMTARCQEEKVDVYTVLAKEAAFVNAALAGRCRNNGSFFNPSVCDGGAPPPVSNAWIGTACASSQTCDFEYQGQPALCLDVDGQGNGFCTVACTGYCPDKSGEAGTFCAELGGSGLCVSKAAAQNSDCADISGTAPTETQRYIGDSGVPEAVARACMPVQ